MKFISQLILPVDRYKGKIKNKLYMVFSASIHKILRLLVSVCISITTIKPPLYFIIINYFHDNSKNSVFAHYNSKSVALKIVQYNDAKQIHL